MKYYIPFIFFIICCMQGCGIREREESLQKRESALNEKEQELLLREKSLQLKETELNNRQQQMDSTRVSDTAAKYNTALIGTWTAKMTCTETTCPGSAVGDTKTETWELAYQNNNIIAQAKVNEELVRVYTGTYAGNILELRDAADTSQESRTKMVVRLHVSSETELQGQREIDRIDENCRIVYALNMQKK